MSLSRSLDLVAPPRARRSHRLRDAALRAVGAVTTPLLPSDYLDLFDPLRSGADLRGRVVAIHPETPGAVSVVIRPGRTWKGHAPGQYVRFGFDVKGVRLWRAYSVTSGPRDDGCITVTVKALPDGKVSNYIAKDLRPGTLLQMDQAAGDFRLPTPSPRRVLFVTGGSGITPVMGILRHRLAHHGSRHSGITLVHSAPTPADVIFGSELQSMHDAGLITLVVRHTDSQGLLTPDDLADLVPDWAERETWACGPTGMLEALEAHWAERGQSDRLHTERFRPHVVVTGEGGTVTFTRSGKEVAADAATPLLDVGEGAGLLMKSGCRMGICYGCVLPLKQGAVRDLRNGLVTTAVPGDEVIIQVCVNAAAGECQIDA